MNEQKQNLISKIFNKNLIKKASTIVLTAGVIVGGVACGNTPDTTTTTTQGPNNNNNQNQNNYSQLLQNVLNDEYYDSLLNEVINGNTEILKTGAFAPHPYAFLEDEGYDVDAIRQAPNELSRTITYVLEDEPNNLYMFTRVLIDNSYYAVYHLRYTLTDKEMEDYNFLFDGNHQFAETNLNFLRESAFINDKISEMKTPTVLGESKIHINGIEKLDEGWSSLKLTETDQCYVCLVNPKLEDKTCKLIVLPKYYTKSYDYEVAFDNVKIVEIDAKLIQMGIVNGVYDGAWSNPYFIQNSTTTKNAKIYDLDMKNDCKYAGHFDNLVK